jgi:hypothetical protein
MIDELSPLPAVLADAALPLLIPVLLASAAAVLAALSSPLSAWSAGLAADSADGGGTAPLADLLLLVPELLAPELLAPELLAPELPVLLRELLALRPEPPVPLPELPALDPELPAPVPELAGLGEVDRTWSVRSLVRGVSAAVSLLLRSGREDSTRVGSAFAAST